MNVVLTGFRGTGKTAVGHILARLLGVPFYDTDALVEEKAGAEIPEIFEEAGEEGFRKLEREVIAALPPGPAVIATGGGAVLSPENVENLRRGRTVILLQADPLTIEKRIRASTRPPLTAMGLRGEILHLLEARRDAYLSAADICVDTRSKSPNEVAIYIKRLLTEGTVPLERAERAARAISRSGIPEDEARELLGKVGGMPENPCLRFYGVAGYPSLHSRSPQLYAGLFRYFGINAHYVRFHDPSLSRILSLAADLDVRGLSVTIPFKQEVISAIDRPDTHCTAIGACNTVLFCGGKSYGYNTDWVGIRDALAGERGRTAVVLGAGGAAAAAAYALLALGKDVTILNRTVEKASALAARLGCSHGVPGDIDGINPDIFVNATPVGMEPDGGSPLSREQLRPGMTVFDLVYTPPETPLLRMARAEGCRVISGKEMFVRQAQAQFKHFTGIDAPLHMVREMVG
ncbi:MAG: shikimate dehydrogenase [Methanolinea sp.]|nr:shikimate dehydrogenase [Methanolinea sp.]